MQKQRTVFLGLRTRRAMIRYLATRENVGADDPLWVNLRTGNRLTVWGVSQALQRLGDMAGVKVNPHKMRRSMGIWALRAGMGIAQLAGILGHSDLQTVRKYLAMDDSDLQQAHAQHGATDFLLDKKEARR